jgi:deoxyribodipyrimidine photo-lyase
VFVFDTHILSQLKESDSRVPWLYREVLSLRNKLESLGSGLWILHGRPEEVIPSFMARKGADLLWAHRDYEPYARQRDALLASLVRMQTLQDHVLVEPSALKPYKVFTPYFKVWRHLLDVSDVGSIHASHLARADEDCQHVPTLDHLGFGQACGYSYPQLDVLWPDFERRISLYEQKRDFPALKGSSYFSPYLRFGQLSIRALARMALRDPSEGARKFLSELAWRDFYQQVLWYWPEVVHESFQEKYRALRFPSREDWFMAWCRGATGYPLVDAGMRQLNQHGYMHNRLRMVCASFLVKDLLVDWRWGEAYFAEKLLDFDLASNNGGWQWAASTGCDAVPYFRIFNPITQSKTYDPEGTFIRKYLPELQDVPNKFIHEPWKYAPHYQPIVDHSVQRREALALYALH